MCKNDNDSKNKVCTCHDWNHDVQNFYSCIFPKYNNCSKNNKDDGRCQWRDGKCIFKGRGNRIADYLTDAAPADKAGNRKKYSKYGVFAISTVFSFCKKMMHIISRSAMVSTIERIFFFVELCQGTFNKSSRRTKQCGDPHPEYSTGTSG